MYSEFCAFPFSGPSGPFLLESFIRFCTRPSPPLSKNGKNKRGTSSLFKRAPSFLKHPLLLIIGGVTQKFLIYLILFKNLNFSAIIEVDGVDMYRRICF